MTGKKGNVPGDPPEETTVNKNTNLKRHEFLSAMESLRKDLKETFTTSSASSLPSSSASASLPLSSASPIQIKETEILARFIALETRVAKLEEENRELKTKLNNKSYVEAASMPPVTLHAVNSQAPSPPIDPKRVLKKPANASDPASDLYAANRINWGLMEQPTPEPTTPAPVSLHSIMEEASRTVGLYPISCEQIFNAAFAESRHENDTTEMIAKHANYEEARVNTAERAI